MDLEDIARDESNEDGAGALNEESSESNKEARIAARRKRVLMKIEAQKRAAQGQEAINVQYDRFLLMLNLPSIWCLQEYESKDDPEHHRASFKQSKKSQVRLEKLVTDGTTLVTNVKVAGDSKEVTRRQDEEEAKKARYNDL